MSQGSLSIHAAAEMAALASVLSSRTFSRAHNLSAILNYICQEHAQGRAGRIKEYNIAVEALGRNAGFDPAKDSVVRVEVSRLRKRLQEFYAAEGASQEVQIQLPEIGYAPHFIHRAQAVEKTPEARSLGSFSRQRVLLAFGVVVLAAVATAVVAARHRANPVNPVASPLPVAAAADTLRIAAGSSAARYVDRSGQVWSGDRYFTGGNFISKPDHRISRTLDPGLYQGAREGEFQYDLPLKPGVYDLHLHFAEIVYRETLGSGPEGQRRFHIIANGKPLVSNFDITLDAPGTDTADERVFKDISPAPDGFLHLRFIPVMNKAILSGIEIVPSSVHRMLPIRILAASRAVYDGQDRFWGADRYFFGGRSQPRLVTIRGTDDPGVFASERFGNFSYFIPVAQGRYSATLRFAESNFGVDNIGSPTYEPGGQGNRVFNIYCNGVALVRSFDIYKDGGGPLRAVAKTFHDLKPNGQGKLVLTFEPIVDYPVVSAIEVLDEGR